MNVTTVNATDASFVQIYPADVDRPLRTSNLNTFPGQAPTPNKVDSKLSATGAIKVSNNTGTPSPLKSVPRSLLSPECSPSRADLNTPAGEAFGRGAQPASVSSRESSRISSRSLAAYSNFNSVDASCISASRVKMSRCSSCCGKFLSSVATLSRSR